MNTILAITALVAALGLVAAITITIPTLEGHVAFAKDGQLTNKGNHFGQIKNGGGPPCTSCG